MSSPEPILRTERLSMRRWKDADRAPFAAMNADPRVVEFLPGPLTPAESDASIERIESHFDAHGFGLWAVEIAQEPGLLGFVGLSFADFEAPFTPAVEVGWRLAHAAWGRGIATEAALAALRFGFERLDLAQIVSFTVPANRRSRAVMERIGLRRDLDGDFDHPRMPVGHPLRPHVLYRIERADFAAPVQC